MVKDFLKVACTCSTLATALIPQVAVAGTGSVVWGGTTPVQASRGSHRSKSVLQRIDDSVCRALGIVSSRSVQAGLGASLSTVGVGMWLKGEHELGTQLTALGANLTIAAFRKENDFGADLVSYVWTPGLAVLTALAEAQGPVVAIVGTIAHGGSTLLIHRASVEDKNAVLPSSERRPVADMLRSLRDAFTDDDTLPSMASPRR